MTRECAGLPQRQLSCGRRGWVGAFLAAILVMSAPAGAQESTGLRGPYFGQISPGTTPVLFAPNLFHDPGEYHAPVVFSPDGTEAYWSPMPGHGRNTTLMSRMVDGIWASQQYVDFGLEAGATEVAFSPDGGTIYFLSTQMLEGERGAYAPEDAPERIWFATRTSDGIGQPQLISEDIVTHRQFSVAANGNLYLTSREPDSGEGANIYVAPFDGTTYSEPRSLGPAINGPGLEHCPFIAPDESYLIFTRTAEGQYNPDLLISYRQPNGSWGEAERLPSPINSEYTEIYPVVSPDGRFLFFLSWREGAGRIFWVEAAFLRPEALQR